MCDHQKLRSACAYLLSDQSPCLLLEYSSSVKLLTKQHLELFLSSKRGCTACLSLFMSKCHIVGNLMSQLKILVLITYAQNLPLNANADLTSGARDLS